jgi:4-aminobutyrate aminotransferase
MCAAPKEVLDRRGIPFIPDQVQTSWGRTGDHFWGSEAHGIVPGMITFAKDIGEGLARGGVIARREIMNGIAANWILHFRRQLTGHRSCLASFDCLLAEDLPGNALRLGKHLRSGLDEIGAGSRIVAVVRDRGLMAGSGTGGARRP